MTADVCARCGRPQSFKAYCVDGRDTPTYADKFGCVRYGSTVLNPEKVTE